MANDYTTLDSTAASVTELITTCATTNAWSGWYRDALIEEVEAARAQADGWFSSDTSELASFWLYMSQRTPYWDSSLPQMDDLIKFINHGTQMLTSRIATYDAQSVSTILYGTGAGSVEDASEIAAAAAEVATTVIEPLKTPITWYIAGAAIMAFMLFRVSR